MELSLGPQAGGTPNGRGDGVGAADAQLGPKKVIAVATTHEHAFGILAHELRTPLAALRAMTEFLLTDAAREVHEWDVFHRNIHDEVVRLCEMMDNLLESARLASGHARWNWGEVRLEPACDEALESVRRMVDRSRVHVEFRVQPADMMMRGDRDAIRRLILNLANNARRYTTQGRIDVTIVCAQEADGRWCRIEVSDTGSGIPSDVAKGLGEAFALNTGGVNGGRSGAGLGLSICKAIVAAHDGSLTVRSREGEGTTVTALLRADLPGPVLER